MWPYSLQPYGTTQVRHIYKEKTEIDFEAVDIEGTNKKPRQALIMENTRALFNPLVKIREEWNQEMLDSLEEIQ